MSSGGEHTALAAFHEAQLPRVRAYVDAVCAPDRSEEAISAAFVDFLARGKEEAAPDRQSDRELVRATRSAAAGRFLVVVPHGRPELALSPECRVMPELLALHANGERHDDEALIAGHLASCAICAHTLARMQEAERAFARGSGELPALEIEATTVDTAGFPAHPALPAAVPAGHAAAASTSAAADKTEPTLQHEGAPQDHPAPRDHPGSSELPLASGSTHRRRSGGLVGAIGRLGRPARG